MKYLHIGSKSDDSISKKLKRALLWGICVTATRREFPSSHLFPSAVKHPVTEGEIEQINHAWTASSACYFLYTQEGLYSLQEIMSKLIF